MLTAVQICAFVNLGISSAAVESGSGRHFNTLNVEQQQNVIKYTIAAFCPGILSFAIPKLAVVALLTKLMNPSPAHRIFLWCSSGVTTLVLFGCVIILYALCDNSIRSVYAIPVAVGLLSQGRMLVGMGSRRLRHLCRR